MLASPRLVLIFALATGAFADDKGINVGSLRVYDNSSLQLMLTAARARLAALEAFDGKSIQGRVGGLSGGTISYRGFAAQVSGPPIPEVSSVSKGATRIESTDKDKGVTTTAPVTDVTTKTAQINPVAPAAPAPSLAMPSGMGPSASDVLYEQLQLSLEIANLQLLLEGAISDRFVKGTRLQKEVVTLGFPISIEPRKDYRGAAAIVEVTVTNPSWTLSDQAGVAGEPPSITMLLPREKTYNVARISESANSIGGGIVTGVISGGASFAWGRKTFYIVQDADTIAAYKPSTNPQSTVFQWQFRPALGRESVREGLRQVFVQLALPVLAMQGCKGNVTVRTYWQKYDQKRSLLRDPITTSEQSHPPQTIRHYDTQPKIERVIWEDAGAGSMLVRVEGRFFAGTYVRIGDLLLTPGPAGITFEEQAIRFVAKAADILQNRPKLVSREGIEVDIVEPREAPLPMTLALGCPETKPAPTPCPQNCTPAEVQPGPTPLTIESAAIVPASDSTSTLTVSINATGIPLDVRRGILLDVAGKVLGLSDAPLDRSKSKDNTLVLTGTISNALLTPGTSVQVKPVFFSSKWVASKEISGIGVRGAAAKLVLLSQTAKEAKFLLYGSRLDGATIVEPALAHSPIEKDAVDKDSLRVVTIATDVLKQYKQIVLLRKEELPVLIPIPAVEDKSKKPEVKAKERVLVGSEEAVLLADSADQVVSITFENRPIVIKKADDKKTVTLTGLKGAITNIATTRELTVNYPEGVKVNVSLDVVTSKIETVAR